MKRWSISMLLAAGVGCTSTVDVLESTTMTIGPEGGTIRSADGIFALTIPPGVLLTDEQIHIRTDRAWAEPDQLSLAYRVEPAQALDVRASVSFQLDAASLVEPGVIARLGAPQPELLGGAAGGGALLADISRVELASYCRLPKPRPEAAFECAETALGAGAEAVALARIPGVPGAPDVLAVLQMAGSSARLVVVDPPSGATAAINYPGELGVGVLGYEYQPGRPVLAVATARNPPFPGRLRLYLYEWTGSELQPRGGALSDDCSSWLCEQALQPDSCRLSFELQSKLTMRALDLDGDGKLDLALGTSSGVQVLYYHSAPAVPGELYQDQACTCGQYGQSPSTFELLQLGGAGEPPGDARQDLVIGAVSGAMVRYGEAAAPEDGPSCGATRRIGALSPVRALARGRFRCAGGACPAEDDLVVVSARSLGGGSFDDPGDIRVVHGAPDDLAQPDLYSRPGATQLLAPASLTRRGEPKDPRSAQVADIDGETHDDLAVLFVASAEIHVWVGGEAELRELDAAAELDACGVGPCSPSESFVLADLDADGRQEIVALCSPAASPRLRRFHLVTP